MLLQPQGDLLLWTEPPRHQGAALSGAGVSAQPRLSELATAGQSVPAHCREHPGLPLLPGSPRTRLSQEGWRMDKGVGGLGFRGICGSLLPSPSMPFRRFTMQSGMGEGAESKLWIQRGVLSPRILAGALGCLRWPFIPFHKAASYY